MVPGSRSFRRWPAADRGPAGETDFYRTVEVRCNTAGLEGSNGLRKVTGAVRSVVTESASIVGRFSTSCQRAAYEPGDNVRISPGSPSSGLSARYSWPGCASAYPVDVKSPRGSRVARSTRSVKRRVSPMAYRAASKELKDGVPESGSAGVAPPMMPRSYIIGLCPRRKDFQAHSAVLWNGE